jgi:hypothetical protein
MCGAWACIVLAHLPGLFDAQPLLAAPDGGFAHLPGDPDVVAAAVRPDMRVVKRGFRREHLVTGQLLEKLVCFVFLHGRSLWQIQRLERNCALPSSPVLLQAFNH